MSRLLSSKLSVFLLMTSLSCYRVAREVLGANGWVSLDWDGGWSWRFQPRNKDDSQRSYSRHDSPEIFDTNRSAMPASLQGTASVRQGRKFHGREGRGGAQQQQRRRRRPNSNWTPAIVTSNKNSTSSAYNNSTDVIECRLPSGKIVQFPRRVPRFLIIGAQKGGTTALAAILAKHPFMAQSPRMEPHFFDGRTPVRGNQPKYTNESICLARFKYLQWSYDVNEYLHQQRQHREMHLFEKTPAYIRHPRAADDVFHVLGHDVKIIAVLRNPVERSYSHYHMERQRQRMIATTYDQLVATEVEALRMAGLTQAVPLWNYSAGLRENETETHGSEYSFGLQNIPRDFATRRHIVWNVSTPQVRGNRTLKDSSLYTGMYATQLEQWLQFYPLGSHLLVLRSEELKANASAVLKRLQAFLNVPMHEFDPEDVEQEYNPLHLQGSGRKSSPRIVVDVPSETTIMYLRRFFKPHNDELAELLGPEWSGVWE